MKNLKNKTAFGTELLKMNEQTYALRRSVIGVIYEAKKRVSIPRLEVRIVESPKCAVLGYAYMGKNIIHITRHVANGSRERLVCTVLHEILHASKNVDHVQACPLMRSHYQPEKESVFWDAFTGYF